MTPEQNESIAKRAYEIFAATSNEPAPWEAVKNKTGWLDGVRDHHNHPDAITRKDDPNLQERSILRAYREMYVPPSELPLVVPPPALAAAAVIEEEKTKGSKAK